MPLWKNIGGTILEHHFLTWVQCVKNELKVFKLLIDLYNLTSWWFIIDESWISKQSWKWFKRSIDLIGPGGQPFRDNKSLVEWLWAAFYLSSLPLIFLEILIFEFFKNSQKSEVRKCSMEFSSEKNEATSH